MKLIDTLIISLLKESLNSGLINKIVRISSMPLSSVIFELRECLLKLIVSLNCQMLETAINVRC